MSRLRHYPDESALLEADAAHVWHPYAPIGGTAPLYPVVSASGVTLELAGGERVIDGMSSWWTAIHGYSHPKLTRAVEEQVRVLSHVMFGGLTHEPAVLLAERLIRLAPGRMEHVFFADSGSVAVEVALKMAVQYWQRPETRRKRRILTVRRGYHGDTFGAMSVCDPQTGMHRLFTGALPEQLFAPAPEPAFHETWDEAYLAPFEAMLEAHSDEIAAVILEPIVQGAGGMRIYSPHYLRAVRERCTKFGVLLIVDEIATGFGRTGTLFACEHAGIAPDIVCVGKALTGGMVTLAATLATSEVARGIASAEGGVLMHGPTFMANPVACAAANASLDLLEEFPWQKAVSAIEAQLAAELAPCRRSPLVRDVRVLGAIGVVELHEPVRIREAQERFVKRGVWLRPFGTLIYTMPPYVISEDELRQVTSAICEAVDS